MNFAVGDYANGVVRGSREQEREKTQERNDVVGVDGGGGGGIEAGFLACHYHIRGFRHLSHLGYVSSYLSRAEHSPRC